MRDALLDFANRAERELTDNILPFWLKHARDADGAFLAQLDDDFTARPGRPRGPLLSSRILWTFSKAYGRYGDPRYLELAAAASADLHSFLDATHGGLIWSRVRGQSAKTAKELYVQAFGVYALSAYHAATGQQAALDAAIMLFQLIERHLADREAGGYLEATTADWASRVPGRVARGYARSQNSLLHLMEAYTALLAVWPDNQARLSLRSVIDIMLDRVVDPATFRLSQYLDTDWRVVSDLRSPGHDIEFAWLLTEASAALGDAQRARQAGDVSVALAQSVLATVEPDGALVNEIGPTGIVDPARHWWVQAEAAVGLLDAYELSGDPKFASAAQRAWAFIETHLIDRVNGGWFSTIGPDGSPDPKGLRIGFWVCPYHNGRACMEIAERARRLAARL